jgi:hypothetical protein
VAIIFKESKSVSRLLQPDKSNVQDAGFLFVQAFSPLLLSLSTLGDYALVCYQANYFLV